jgi:hypothetical protein
MVIEQVTARVASLRHGGDTPTVVRQVLLQTMPADDDRHIESSIAVAFLALGLGDPDLARVQRLHFTSMYDLCVLLVRQLDAEDLLNTTGATTEILARRLHAIVDGLTVQVLAGHLNRAEMAEQLHSYLDDLARRD